MESKKCWYCGKEITGEYIEIDTQGHGFDRIQYWHKKCAKEQGMDKDPNYDEDIVLNKAIPNNSYEQTAIEALRIFSWVNLVAGVLGAIIVWVKFSVVEHHYYLPNEYNPTAIILGFVLMFEGFFGWALFLVISSMANNINEIRQNISNSEH